MIMMWWCWSKLSLLVLFPSLLYGFVKSLWLSLAKHFQYTALLQWSWKRDRLDWLQPTVLHLLSIHLNLYTCLYILHILYIIFIYILYYIYIHLYIYTYTIRRTFVKFTTQLLVALMSPLRTKRVCYCSELVR